MIYRVTYGLFILPDTHTHTHWSRSGYCYLLPSATKLRRLCFYTCLSVILFTGGGCAIPACIAGGIPACFVAGGYAIPACLAARECYPSMPCSRGGLPLGGACSRGVPAPRGVCYWGSACSREGLWRPHRKQTATVADGMHPTGMHSWSNNGYSKDGGSESILEPESESVQWEQFLYSTVL